MSEAGLLLPVVINDGFFVSGTHSSLIGVAPREPSLVPEDWRGFLFTYRLILEVICLRKLALHKILALILLT